MQAIFKYIKGDKVIWVTVFLLSIISILAVYSSVMVLAFKSKTGNVSYFLAKHITITGLGIMLIYLTHKIRYTYFSRLSQLAIYLSVPLLLFTLLKGVSEGSAHRWLEIPGTGLTFQTSDFAKLALIIYVVRIITLKRDVLSDFKKGFMPVLLPVIAICGLIFPSNISTSFLLFMNCLFIMFIGGAKLNHLFLTIGVALAGMGLFILIVFAFPRTSNRIYTAKSRIESYFKGDNSNNYQSDQAMIAISTGGLFGKGPGNSTQKNFLPQASSDFIYAILVEEYGLVMALVIIFLYMTILFRGIRIATRNPKTFGSLLVIGLSLCIVIQALVNICVAVHLLPVTGQPLPMVSMGGTSIWFSCIAVGIILSVSKETESEPLNLVEAT